MNPICIKCKLNPNRVVSAATELLSLPTLLSGRFSRTCLVVILLLCGISVANAQVTTNGGSGLAATYPTLAGAITALNAATISSPVVITLTGIQTAPAAGYSITATGTAVNTITIQGSGATVTAFSPQAAGGKTDAIFKIVGGDYITIQNFILTENAANTVTILATNNMTEFGIGIFLVSGTNGAQNNSIKNNTITLSPNYQNAIGIFSTSSSSAVNTALAATATTGTNSNNKLYGNDISDVAYGVYIISEPITAAINETGWDIGGTGATTGNIISFGNAVLSDIALTRFFATVPAGIFMRNGTGASIRFNNILSYNFSYLQSGGITGIYLVGGGTTPTGVTYTATVSDNTLSVSNAGTTAISGIDYGAGISTGTIVCNNNQITINQDATAAVSAAITGVKANYPSATNTINNNTVVINQSNTTGSTTSAVIGINAAGAGTTVNVQNNPNITIKQAVSGTGSFGAGAITFINVSAASGTVNVAGNNINTNGSTMLSTGTLIGINQDATVTVLVNIKNNICTINRTAASGAASFLFTSATALEAADTISLNNITFTGLAGTSSVTAISSGGGPASPAVNNKSICNNTISLTGTHTGSSIGISSSATNSGAFKGNSININSQAGTMSGISTTASASITGNTLSLSSSVTVPSAVSGIVATGSSGAYTINNNTVGPISLSAVGTTAANAIGINSLVTTTGAVMVSNNYVSNLTVGAAGSTGSATVVGINVSGGVLTISKNSICSVSTLYSGTSTLVSGLRITGGSGTGTISNNRIGGLSSSVAVNSDGIRGINMTAAGSNTTFGVYYNTVHLNATTTAATFGSSGLYHTASATGTTASLDLRNNIISNTSASAGAGLTASFRRSGTALNNYNVLSNRNDFIATTIYTNGTNTFSAIGTYQSHVAARDANSLSLTPSFISIACGNSNFLKINTSIPTLLESRGVNIAGITDDFENETRQGNAGYPGLGTLPDLGADEFNGSPCTGTPAATTITGVNAVCTGTGTTLSLSTVYLGTGIQYQWVSGTTPGGPYPTVLGTASTQVTAPSSVPRYYKCTVTCSNGGGTFTTAEKAIGIIALPVVSITPGSASYCSPSGPPVNLTANGATSYTWSPATGLSATTGATVAASPASATTYIVSGTDANGCVNTASVLVSLLASPSVTATATPANFCSGSNSQLTASVPPNSSITSYAWTPSAFISGQQSLQNPVATNVTATTVYTVTVTNAAGCSATASATVSLAPVSCDAITIGGVNDCEGTKTITAHPIGGGAPYSYSWKEDGLPFPGNTATIFPSDSTHTYICTITDACGAVCSSSIEVTTFAVPDVVVTPSSGLICSPGGAAVMLTASGANTYSWAPANGLDVTTEPTVSALPDATTLYTVTGMEVNGCTKTATALITVTGIPQNIIATATPSNVCINAASTLKVSSIIPFAANGYSFSYTAGAGTLDPMTGATTVVGSSVDDAPMALSGTTAGNAQPIGFTLYFEGRPYTHYSASPDGWIKFSNNILPAIPQFINNATNDTNLPKIYPLWSDLATGTNGGVKSLVTGTAPNRIFKVQWFVNIPRNTAGPANATFQAWVYEANGKIEYRYGTMGTAASASKSAGLTGVSVTPIEFHSITFAGNTSSNTVPNNANTLTVPATGTLYTYTAPVPVLSYAWSPAARVVNPSVAQTLTQPITAASETFSVVVSNGACAAAPISVTVTTASLAAGSISVPTLLCSGAGFTATANTTGGSILHYAWSDGAGGVYPDAASVTMNFATGSRTLSVTVTQACGASVSMSKPITINASPNVSVSPLTGSLCSGGGSYTLTASGAPNYSWSPAAGLNVTTGSSVVASPVTTTSYVVTGTAANGCTGMATAVITAGVAPIGGLAAVAATTLCAGNTINLSSSATLPGYAVNINSAVAFVDISASGTPVDNLGDDSQHDIFFPAAFNYNGVAYTGARVSNNGMMIMGTGNVSSDGGFDNQLLPAAASAFGGSPVNTGPAVICAYWDDLLNDPTTTLRTGLVGSKFIIQWTNEKQYNAGGSPITFQIQLDQTNGKIHLVYQDVTIGVPGYDGGETATVGLNFSETSGQQFSYNTASLVDGQSITYTPNVPTFSWSGPNGFSSTLQNPVIRNVTPAASGIYTVTFNGTGGCTATAATASVTVNGCGFNSVTVKAFLEGFYAGGSTMTSNLFALGISTDPMETDTIEINLWDPADLASVTPHFSKRVVLHTDGTALALFPGGVTGPYYIAIKHRNSLETWSTSPVMISASATYDFRINMSAAFADVNSTNTPMKVMADGKMAFYGGDVDQDGTVAGSDMNEVDNGTAAFDFGYNPADCNGDGETGGADMNIVDNNTGLFLFYARPY